MDCLVWIFFLKSLVKYFSIIVVLELYNFNFIFKPKIISSKAYFIHVNFEQKSGFYIKYMCPFLIKLCHIFTTSIFFCCSGIIY